MDTKLIEFLSLSIIEEAKAIQDYSFRASNSGNATTTKLFNEIKKDECEHLRELINELSRVSQDKKPT